jgi:hypothetical protein
MFHCLVVTVKKELLMTMMMIMSENQSSQSQIHGTVLRGTEGLAVKKPILNTVGYPGASL